MDLEQIKADFAAALQEFEAVEANLPAEPESPSLYARFATSIRLVFSSKKISLDDAKKGILAAKKSLRALAEQTNDPDTYQRYVDAMRAMTAELTAVVNKKLQGTAYLYEPLTAAFRGSAATLRQAHQKAVQMASALKLTADILNAFTKLVSAL
jgi:hypothetical protein